jgi:hypothetical protein
MTRAAEGRGQLLSQYFFKKIIILKFFYKLSHVFFINHQGCIWIYKID